MSAAALKAGVKPRHGRSRPRTATGPATTRTSACPANGPSAVRRELRRVRPARTARPRRWLFALAKSCNTAFAALAVDKLGGAGPRAEAQLFGLDGDAAEGAADRSPARPSAARRPRRQRRRWRRPSFGQRDVRITPLQAAMISAAVANNGTLMQPYLVESGAGARTCRCCQKHAARAAEPGARPGSATPSCSTMMDGVVTEPEGTGGPAKITDLPGVVVGGKTGTADAGILTSGSETPPRRLVHRLRAAERRAEDRRRGHHRERRRQRQRDDRWTGRRPRWPRPSWRPTCKSTAGR